MPHPRKFRFAAQLSKAPDGTARSWAEQARKAQDLGYSTLLVPDHFGDQLAPVPALMAAADATSTLKVGVLVFDNDYRHPLVLAKEAATLDLLSDGRLELGLGAGWMRSDYDESGIAYDEPAVRVDRFEEKPEGEVGPISGGFFVLSPDVLDLIAGDATLWEREPMEALARQGELMGFRHDGFWQPMDTQRDRVGLDQLWESGHAPWKRWPDPIP